MGFDPINEPMVANFVKEPKLITIEGYFDK
jgi:hypothetical protein